MGKAHGALLRAIDQRSEAAVNQALGRVLQSLSDYQRLGAPAIQSVARSFQTNLSAFRLRLQDKSPDAQTLDTIAKTGRLRCVQGISLNSIMRAHRIWSRELWGLFSDVIPATPEPEMITSLAAELTDHLELCISVLIEGYIEQMKEVMSKRAEGEEGERLLQRLCLGEPVEWEICKTSVFCEFTAAKAYAVLVFASPDSSLQKRWSWLRALSTSLFTTAKGACLSGSLDNDLVVIYADFTGIQVDDLKQRARLFLNTVSEFMTPESLVVGIGDVKDSLEAVSQSYKEAKEVVRLGLMFKLYGTVLTYEDILIQSMVLSRPDLARRLVRKRIAPLLEYDHRHASDLFATLQAYIEHDGHLIDASRILSVHPNTVLYRLAKIAELSGKDPRRSDGWMEFKLALLALKAGLSGQHLVG